MRARAIIEAESPKKFLRSVAPRYFKLTFDFGAGEGLYSCHIEIPGGSLAGIDPEDDESLHYLVQQVGPEQCPQLNRDDWQFLRDIEPA